MAQMLVLLLFTFCTIYSCLAFHQDTYHINHGTVVIEYFNSSALSDPSVTLEDFNSTCSSVIINASADVSIPIERNVLITALPYKMYGDEYRSFPMNVTLDLCEEFKLNKFATNIAVKHSNLQSCPIVPGHYYLKDYVLEEEKFPPQVPLGKYKLFVEVYVDDVIFLGNGTWEGEIVEKNKE